MPYYKEYYLRNREKISERHRKNRLSAPEKRKQQQRGWNYKHRLKKFGISEEWFDETLKSQKGKCAICGKKFIKNKPHIDHCHKTNKARGLLCLTCDTGLGHIEKWREDGFFDRAAEYLNKKH